MRRIYFLLLFILFGVLPSCISNKKMVYLQDKSQKKPHKFDQTESFKVESDTYKIEQNDVLFIEVQYQSLGQEKSLAVSSLDERESRIAVAQHPYTSGFQVSDGKIVLQDLGEFEVLGKSIEEVKSLITSRANDSYVNPTVKIYLMNAFVTVLGDVNRPGRFQLFDEINILEAIGLAGDLGEFADRGSVKVLRSINDKYEIYHLDLTDQVTVNSQNFIIRPGDVIMVKPQERKKYAGRNIQWILSGLSVVVSIVAILSR